MASKTWKSSGGDGAFTATSLANGSARQGGKVDVSTLLANVRLQVRAKPTSAATTGLSWDLYLSWSNSATAATDNDGDATGTDAAYPTDGALADRLKALQFVGSLVATAANESHVGFVGQVRRLADYCSPVLVNNCGVALSSTASDHEIIMHDEIVDP